jgi:hypothetical protein
LAITVVKKAVIEKGINADSVVKVVLEIWIGIAEKAII